MKTVSTLIKLAKQKVDRQQLRLAKLQDTHADLSNQKQLLNETLKNEANKARHDPFLIPYYGNFAHDMELRINHVQAKIDEAALRVQLEQDRLTTLFKDQKVLEVYKTNQEYKAKRKRTKRSQHNLDEVAARLRRTQAS